MKETHGIDPSNMNIEISPKQDFYSFANGGWEAKTTIPDDEARWGSFNELREKNDDMTLALVDKALMNKTINPNSDEGKVATFFNLAMDTDKLNAEGIAPIQPFLDQINAISSIDDVVDFTIDSAPYFGGLFGAGPNADLKNSNITALYLGTGSLGLPERDYYVGEDEDSEDKRAKYVTHTARMFGFLGESDADAMAIAKEIMAMETKMAESLMTKEESRNPLLRYNPKSIAELSKLSSSIDWAKYFDGIGAGSPEQIIVTQPNYIERLEKLLNSEDLSTIKNYLRWHVLDGSASFLSDEIDEANFDFFGKTLRDLKVQKPRKERVLRTTNGVLGEALGKLYVAEYFPIEAKETARQMERLL